MKWSLLAGLGLGAAVALLYSGGRRRATIVRVDAKRVRERTEALRSEASSRSHPHSILAIINEWPHHQLIEIHGIGPVLATKIISHRPYRTAQEFVDSKLLPPRAIEALQKAA